MLSKKMIYKKFNELSKSSSDFLVEKNKKLIKRKKQTDIFDALLFKILYSQKYKTHDDITIAINKFKNTKIHRSSFEERAKLIDFTFLSSYYEFLNSKIDELFYKDMNKQTMPIIACDGVKGTAYATTKNSPIKLNKNKSNLTFLSMGFFNVTYNDPSMMQLLNHKNERKGSINTIDSINNDKPKIFCCDRGFFSLDYFNKISKSNNFFVCRIRNNSTLIDNKKEDYNVVINEKFLSSIRIINYKINDSEYHVATNLPRSLYDNKNIIDIYKKRWNVEEYFKYIKNNMKMDNVIIKDWDSIKSTVYMNFVVSKLTYLIFNIFKNKMIKKPTHTINKTRLTKDFFENFIIKFIYNHKFSERFLIDFFKTSILIITTNVGDSNKRVGMFPYTKWYTKGYFKKYTVED